MYEEIWMYNNSCVLVHINTWKQLSYFACEGEHSLFIAEVRQIKELTSGAKQGL